MHLDMFSFAKFYRWKSTSNFTGPAYCVVISCSSPCTLASSILLELEKYSLYFQASWLVGIKKIARQTIPEAATLKGLIARTCVVPEKGKVVCKVMWRWISRRQDHAFGSSWKLECPYKALETKTNSFLCHDCVVAEKGRFTKIYLGDHFDPKLVTCRPTIVFKSPTWKLKN